ncbi:hypothetical protein Sjap_002137 [Stephania japonica]|uniref:NAD(P)H dehydrogenase (quinone) n=1 Tax=Stephania japonica TaxID=461633 RepID=A0AAP0PSD0_9MAGN
MPEARSVQDARTLAVKVKSQLPTESVVRPTIRVAGLCGSLRRASFSRGLLRAATAICEESIGGMTIEYVDISALPFINTDLEADGTYPPVVEAFRQKILEADCVLFASPEYNYSNAIDWASRPPNVWADKPAAIISAGGGFGGGVAQYHLRQIGVFLNLHFINKPEFTLNAFQPPQKFDSDGNLISQRSKNDSWKSFWRCRHAEAKSRLSRPMEAAVVRPTIRVAGLCGSLRRASFNRGLLRAGRLLINRIN